jgi:hypothetical protein
MLDLIYQNKKSNKKGQHPDNESKAFGQIEQSIDRNTTGSFEN